VAIFRVYAEWFKTPIWGSKTPSNVFWLKEIQEDFPRARYVFIYRDGRDVSLDQVRVHWGPTNLYTASLLWRSYIQAILNAKKLLPLGSYHEIYYEDLVRDPETVVRGMCEFLELEYEPGMLAYHHQPPDAFLEQAYHHMAKEPITTEYVGMYKGLPPDDRQLQVAVVGGTLKELGYEVADMPREIGFWERERYLEEDRHGGLVLEGAVEYKHLLRQRRLEREGKGIWSTQDRVLFQRG
jgi:hypothetical protein